MIDKGLLHCFVFDGEEYVQSAIRIDHVSAIYNLDGLTGLLVPGNIIETNMPYKEFYKEWTKQRLILS